ncbi:lipid IV(A) 4-amino-4-deoxy-L-arabinosyltransferase [Aeromonas veronii]|uniref:lipid IV(A) 4-amino-4-deoxy-L-arabinosyltransferase n=1 Tax=unclassified Aeromonas TaxID=257493 RepID=UPI0038E6207E
MKMTRWALPLFFLAFYLLPLNQRMLWSPDENRYAEISREMITTGDWVVPHFLGLRYFEKPIAGYWFNSLSQLLFGESNFAVRFASAAATGLSALLIFWFALQLWQCRRTAWFASLIYLSTLIVYGIGTYSVLDAMVTLWLNAAMVSFYLIRQEGPPGRRVAGYLLFGLACGMGFLTKGFIALAVPVVAIMPYAIYQRRLRELVCFGPLAILSAALLVAPWAIAVHLREPDYWHYFFWIEHIQRFASEDAQHKAPFWYYLPMGLLGTLPWLGLLPGALKQGWQARKNSPETLYLLAWVVLPLLFFSIAKGKLLTYILPCFAPLAMLMATSAVDKIKEGKERAFKLNAWLNGLFGLIGLVVLTVLALSRDHAIYGEEDHGALSVAMAIFIGWSLLGLIQLQAVSRRWVLSALCPMILAIGLPWALPQSLIDSKLPERFIETNQAVLQGSETLLASDPGLASALARSTRRGEIMLFDDKGELAYGLGYPDAKGRYVARAEFPRWLAQAREKGQVALLMKTDHDGETGPLPPADETLVSHRLTLLIYHGVR